jgi:DNA-binding NtrC family response regulator
MGNSTEHTDVHDLEIEDLRDSASVPEMVHVVISTREEELLWSVFDGFSELATVRVTGCSTLPQTRQVCAADPPSFLIIDMDLLDHDSMDLVTLANLSDCHTHIVALSRHPVFEIGARFGKARLTFLQKPVSAHDLLLLLRVRISTEDEARAEVC